MNILVMSVTLAVLKLDKSSEVSDSLSENIFLMSVTLAVLKLDKSSEVSQRQHMNI